MDIACLSTLIVPVISTLTCAKGIDGCECYECCNMCHADWGIETTTERCPLCKKTMCGACTTRHAGAHLERDAPSLPCAFCAGDIPVAWKAPCFAGKLYDCPESAKMVFNRAYDLDKPDPIAAFEAYLAMPTSERPIIDAKALEVKATLAMIETVFATMMPPTTL